MENRLAAERVIIANLLFMLLTFRFFHTATIIVRLDRSTCRGGVSAALAVVRTELTELTELSNDRLRTNRPANRLRVARRHATLPSAKPTIGDIAKCTQWSAPAAGTTRRP